MATLNPQSLVTLWQIEQYGSFSATAKATGWSQPAISQQIKKLEAQCGSTLVQRTSHGHRFDARPPRRGHRRSAGAGGP